jgi:glycosyltransferase involved in cell wall biosynthesis
VVGDGHLRTELELLARELGIAEKTVFAGFRKDASSLVREFDVSALSSLNEGTPLTLIEAMAGGRPVIATEVGGVVDLMGARHSGPATFSIWDHGVTVPSGDANALAEALAYLYSNPAIRRRMGEQARIWVRRFCSKERLVSDIGTLYHEMIGNDAAPSFKSGAALQYEWGEQQ